MINYVPQPGIHPSASTGHHSSEQAAEGRDCVKMSFDRAVLFTAEVHGPKVQYTKGTHLVPREWSTNWYLAANGAVVVADPGQAEKPKKK